MKERRHRSIRKLIAAGSVRSQAEILEYLRSNGFEVTQASVSRDLEEIGIRKVHGVYSSGAHNGFESALGKVTLARSGSSLVVARCGSGLASALAVRVDSLQMQEIVGTIAGDDTVFIATKNAKGQTTVLKQLKERFGG